LNYNLRKQPWKPKVGDTLWSKEHHLSKAVAKVSRAVQNKKFSSRFICILEHAATRKVKIPSRNKVNSFSRGLHTASAQNLSTQPGIASGPGE